MKRFMSGVMICCAGLVLACSSAARDATTTSAVESAYTELSGPSCTELVDKNDPNETLYFSCAGVAGYRLIVRRAESGRRSIDVMDSAQRLYPLAFPETVTPDMSTLRAKAEWRVTTVDGKAVPIALIIGVEAREKSETPEVVTRTYLAIAKIASSESCVVESIAEGVRSANDVRTLADSAQFRTCKLREPK